VWGNRSNHAVRWGVFRQLAASRSGTVSAIPSFSPTTNSPLDLNRTYNNRVACFLQSIRLKNILSFKDAKLPLESLNVLIGPNAAGKSNLIDVVGLLRATPEDLNGAILRGGGAPAWIRRGENGPPGVGGIECELRLDSGTLEYALEFSSADRAFVIERESLRGATRRGRVLRKIRCNR
jgi:hypothetical protein